MKNLRLRVALIVSALVVIAFVWTIRIARLFGLEAFSHWWDAGFAVSVLVFGLLGAMYWWSGRASSREQNREFRQKR